MAYLHHRNPHSKMCAHSYRSLLASGSPLCKFLGCYKAVHHTSFCILQSCLENMLNSKYSHKLMYGNLLQVNIYYLLRARSVQWEVNQTINLSADWSGWFSQLSGQTGQVSNEIRSGCTMALVRHSGDKSLFFSYDKIIQNKVPIKIFLNLSSPPQLPFNFCTIHSHRKPNKCTSCNPVCIKMTTLLWCPVKHCYMFWHTNAIIRGLIWSSQANYMKIHQFICILEIITNDIGHVIYCILRTMKYI
jgi:hypothetical protein